MGDFVLEARFEPPDKGRRLEARIYIPVHDVNDLIAKDLNHTNVDLEPQINTFVDKAMVQYDNPGLIRLLVVTAHELGHYISFCSGNHDNNLADGITLMHQGKVLGYDRLTSLVFMEEVTAWTYAKNHLERYEFVWWEVFSRIKLDSLSAYNKLLKLEKASVAVFAKLSMIDEFRAVVNSDYFAPKDSK